MRVLVYVLSFLLALQCMLGCGKGNEESKAKNSAGYTITDGRGKKIHFAKKPERIVTLHYSTDEILLDLVDASRVKAVSRGGKNKTLCNNLEKTTKIPLVVEENVEFMLKNQVDLLIIRENYKKDFITQAEQANIPVAVVKNPKDIEGVRRLVRSMAEIVGEKETGEKLVQEMDKKLETVKKDIVKDAPPKTAMVVSSLGASSLKGSIVDDIFKHANLKNATEKLEVNLPPNGKVRLSQEQIVMCDPDYLLFITFEDLKGGPKVDKAIQEFKSNPSYANLKAIKNNNIILIPMKYTICFSHYIGDNILALSKAVYQKDKQ